MVQTARVIYRRILVISIIGILLVPGTGIVGHNFAIQERTQPIAQPEQLWNGFIKREWQPFLEQRFLNHIKNLRSFLILAYNEAKHQLFPTRPNNFYFWTPQLGYYPVDTIRRLNGDVLRHDSIKQHYQRAAHRLHILQGMLSHRGVALVVVTPPPKVRVYPEYAAPYLIAPAESIMSRAISYGDVLEENGVNTINVQRIFAERKAASQWPYFTTTSFHWSFWAGCLVTDEIMRKSAALTGHPFFAVGCSDVEFKKSQWSDADIASILNIFSTDSIIGKAPFPKIVPQQNSGGDSRKILIIGDSFSDHIVYALTHALPDISWSPGWLTRYDSYISRQTIGGDGRVTASAPLQKDGALSEILTKDLLVIEVSDGNIYRDAGGLSRMEFGATQDLLNGLLQTTDSKIFDPANSLTSGWRGLGNDQWRTTGYQASFAIRPSTNSAALKVALDIENLAPDQSKPRVLDILLDGKSIGQATMARGRRSVLDLTVPSGTQWQDSLVAEISLRDTSGQPLDILAHGVRIVDANAMNANKALGSSKMPSHAGLPVLNLIGGEEPEYILVDGLSGLESNGKVNWRWALGPATHIKFYVDPTWPDQARQFQLKFSFKNGVPIPDQSVTLRLNGKDIRHFSSEEIAKHEQIDADVTLSARKGVNVLEFYYQDWNHGKKISGNDPRQLAVVFTQLSLQGLNK